MLVSWLPVTQFFLQGLMLTLFPTCPVGQVEEKINFAQKCKCLLCVAVIQ